MGDDLNAFLANDPTPAPDLAGQDVVPQELSTPETSPEVVPEEPAKDEPSQAARRDHAIWREEREKRKDLQRQVDQMNARWAEMMQRMQQPAQAPEPEAAIPSFDDDPIGHLKARNDRLESELQQARQFQTQQVQAAQAGERFTQMRDAVDQRETEFAKANPDYHQAVGHLYAQVDKMAEAMGYPPAARKQIIQQTAMDITMRAMQAGENPAEIAYRAARGMGWTGAKPPADESAPPPAVPTSLGSVAGRPSAGTPTWEAVSKMNDAEFGKFWDDMARSARG